MIISPPEAIGAALGLQRSTVGLGLRMLARVGFLVETDGGDRPVAGHQTLPKGLGFNFHTVTLEGGQQFNVPGAVRVGSGLAY